MQYFSNHVIQVFSYKTHMKMYSKITHSKLVTLNFNVSWEAKSGSCSSPFTSALKPKWAHTATAEFCLQNEITIGSPDVVLSI